MFACFNHNFYISLGILFIFVDNLFIFALLYNCFL